MTTLVLADIVSGEVDWADVFFLIAVILFVVAAVIAVQVKTFYAALMAGGLAFGFLGLLML